MIGAGGGWTAQSTVGLCFAALAAGAARDRRQDCRRHKSPVCGGAFAPGYIVRQDTRIGGRVGLWYRYGDAGRRNPNRQRKFHQRENHSGWNCDRVLLLGVVCIGDAAGGGAAGVLSRSGGHLAGGVAHAALAGSADRGSDHDWALLVTTWALVVRIDHFGRDWPLYQKPLHAVASVVESRMEIVRAARFGNRTGVGSPPTNTGRVLRRILCATRSFRS